MGAVFAYSIAAGIMLTMLYLIARLALGRQTYHALSRWSLIASLIISLSIPGVLMIDYSVAATTAIEIPAQIIATPITDLPTTVSAPEAATSLWLQILILIYVTGAAICMVRFMISVFNMERIIRSGRPDGNFSSWKIIRHSVTGLGSCSWGSYILLHDNETYDRSVMIHESAHLSHKHWIDMIVMELAAIFLWYWPTAWLLRRDLSEIHEYQADAEVLASGIDARKYQIMLLKKAAGPRFHSIACSLNNHSNISKRIKMMLNQKSRPAVRLRAAWAVPAVALGIGVLCSPLVSSALDTVSEAKVTNFFNSTQTPVTETVDTVTTTKTTVVVRDRNTDDNAEAEKKTVLIIDGERKPYSEMKRLNFNDVDLTVFTGFLAKTNFLTREEINAGKNTVIIVQTKSDNKQNTVVNDQDTEFSGTITVNGENKPYNVRIRKRPTAADDQEAENSIVLIVDGKRKPYKVMKQMNQANIESITVLKDSAVRTYLDEQEIKAGKNTVMVIQTKKQ